MKNKINSYVKYIFNINNIKDDEMFLEVTTNLHDRYQSLIEEGLHEEDAYLKTIDTLGDFNFSDPKIEESFNYKPSWANIALWVSLGLAVIATIVLLLNNTMSILFTGISISLYIGSSYYLYHLSQYTLKEEKDINKHNELLKGIFKNLKTSFIFWNINISYWITSVIASLILTLTSTSVLDPSVDVLDVVLAYAIIFIVIFSIIFIIFRNVYLNIEKKYFELTQQEKLVSYVKEASVFKLNSTTIKVLTIILKVVLVLAYTTIILATGIKVRYANPPFGIYDTFTISYNPYNDQVINGILIIATLISSVFTLIVFCLNKYKLIITGWISLAVIHLTSVLYLIIYFNSNKFIAEQKRIESYGILNIISILLVISSIIYVTIKNKKNKYN